MERANKYVACVDCGADVTSERIKYQQEDGSTLCEKCYVLSRMRGGVRYSSVRAVVVALRFAAYAVLVLTFVSILSRMAIPDYKILQVALYGTLAFLLFIGLSEGISIVLALSRQALENSIKMDRILESLERTSILLPGEDGS